MCEEEDIYQPPDTEDDIRKYLLENFYMHLQMIDNQRPYAIDHKFPPLVEKYEDDISAYVAFPSTDDGIDPGRGIPLFAAKAALDVVIKFLDNDWELDGKMRKYLSSRFKKALDGGGESLQSLFHIRKSDSDDMKHTQKLNIGEYIVFRMRLHERVKNNLKSDYRTKKVFYNMICDELISIYKIKSPDQAKMKRYAEYALVYLPFMVYARGCDFLCAYSKCLKEYWRYSKKYFSDCKGNEKKIAGLKKARISTLEWIKGELKTPKANG